MSCLPSSTASAQTSCANCGKEGNDGTKLKNCTACLLVKYCSVDCQRVHRRLHKKACKERAAELKDERLYGRGHERPGEDFCPLCLLAIQFPVGEHAVYKSCCMKMICNGCSMAANKRGMFDCPFCRTPHPGNDAARLAMIRARVLKKDPAAIHQLGGKYVGGELGLQKDMRRAVELWTEAAELGSVNALHNLGVLYACGDGVREDRAKAAEFYEKAAMQGHAGSRCNLGLHEAKRGNHGRAVKHLLISSKMGLMESVEIIKKMFMGGMATKEQYAEALRGYQDAVAEMESRDRDEAKVLRKIKTTH